MNSYFVISLLLVAVHAYGFRLPAASFGYRVSRIPSTSNSLLFARPEIGDVVVAKVDDIGGSFKDPMVYINIDRDGEVLKGRLPSKLLSAQERLAIQSGSMLRVAITGQDKNGYIASLPGRSSSVIESRNDFGRPQQAGGRRYDNNNKPKPVLPTTPPGPLMNNLKTGMKFEGTVKHVTPYAAFVDANIFRRAKGGVFAPVNGLLSKHDMSEDVINRDQDSNSRQRKAFALEKGSKVAVYVKEVYKNAGRFTWSMDPSIKKESILEQKRQNREEGKERRQSRRLRRQLEPLLAGDSITGVVDRVTTEGVLVTISSLGPLNVTALISVRDMPKQFEVPGDLASSFQVEILQQDFYPGREVRCSVLKIHPSPSPSKKYNIKLLFEDFEGQANYDDVEITDRGEVTNVKVLKNGGGAEYDDEVEDYDDDDEDEEVDLEIVEIFDELRGADSQVEVEKFLAWEDILDMIEEGNISQKDIINMMRSIGAKGKYLDIKEFNKVINMIQDHLEEQELVGEDLDDDDEDADEEEDDKNNLDGDDDDFGDDGDDAEDIAEIYSDLKGDNQYLSVGSLKNWAEIKEILKSKQVSMAKIDQMLKDLRVDGKKGLTLTQFQSFVNSIDEAIMFEEDMKEVEQEKEVKKPKETKVVAVEQPPVVVAKKGKVEKVEEEGDYDEDAEDDTFFLEIFNDLKNKQGVVTINAFKEWDDVREMIADGDLTESKLDSVIEDVVGFSIQKKGKKASAAAASTFILSFDQFKEILEILDQELMENSVDEEVGDDEEDMNAVENSEEDGTDGEQMAVDDEELNRELFEELSQDGKVVKVKAFREWDEMVELFDQQYLDKDSFEAILLEVGAKPNGNLNFQQFSQLLRLIDETTQAMAGGINPEDAVVDSKGTKKSVATEEDEDDDYIEEDDEDYSDEDEEGVNEEIVREMFDDLRGKSSKLSMSKLKNWDLLQEMIDQNVMSLATFNVLVQEVTDQPSPKDLDFEQFKQIVKLLNQANDLVNGEMPSAGDDEEEESMLDEQTSQEFFDALKGKNGKVSIKSLKSWDVLEDELESGALTLKDIDEAVVAAGFTSTTQLTLPDFIKVLDEIGDRVRGLEGEDDEEYDDEEEEEEESKESLAAKQKEAALQAAFSNRKTADSASSAGKSSTGTGFQRQSEDEIKQGKARAKEAKQAVVALPPANNKLKQRIDEVTQDMFDELRGKSKTIPLKAFRQWDELNKMLNNGKVKHSTLERALHKFGVLDNESLDLEQFAQILEVLQQAVDFSDLGAAVPDVTANKQMKTSKNSKVLLTKDDNDANEEEDEDNSIPADLDEEDEEGDEEEEAALEIFDELCGPKRKALPLADFFKWEDIQSLLESGALTKEKLALAVEQTGVDVSKPEQCKLNFATFYDLLQIIDHYVDSSKLEGGQQSMPSAEEVARSRLDEEDEDEDEDEDDNEDNDDDDDYDEDGDLINEEEELREMFAELSQGKETISEKDLRSWDELQEMISSEMIAQSTVDSYIKSLKIKKGKIDFEQFQKFMELLDGSMLDEDPEVSEWLNQK